MNILIIHNSYRQAGGEDVVVAQESELLRQHGHTVHTYVRSNHEFQTLSFPERLGLFARIISANDSRRAVRGLLRDLRPDVVHVHNTFFMVSPSVYAACLEEDVPVVQTLHNYRLLCPGATFYRDGRVCEECLMHSLLRSVRHACYRKSRVMTGATALMLQTHRMLDTWERGIGAYIALSLFQKNRFVQSGFPESKIHVKPNFVEPDPGGEPHSGDYALFVGRLSPEKGVATLLRAWELLPVQIPLVISGDGPLRSFLEAEIAAKGLQAIRLAGHVGRDGVYALMKKAAFLVVPSVWEEPFGLIIVEAFACGTPVLGASTGAIEEMVEDGVTGLRFKAGGPVDLAEKVEWAWSHPCQLAAIGKRCRRAYEERYTAEINHVLLTKIYASAIEAHSRVKRKRSSRAAA